jgi:oxygen-independent coproporphyrinogen-3 oxidase
MNSKEASLYVHIPFCTKKCPYCHFYVVPDKDPFKQQLLTALELEWRTLSPKLEGKNIVSIYFGGGTPSLMGSSGIEKILNWFPRIESQEITLEANPENISLKLMQEMRSIGINRVSIGIQTLDNLLLKRLGRGHTKDTALRAIETTFEAGIENISIDLMYELPGQTLAIWEETLQQLAPLPLSHLSLYNLTIEPHTTFYKQQKELTPHLPSPEECLKMLNTATSYLPKIGLERYEISAFAKKGKHSRHNTGYWTARPFLGLGPSAFSYWDKKRYRNVANLTTYAQALAEKRSPVDFEETLPYPDNLNELLAVELRLLRGVHLPTFETRHGSLPSSTLTALTDAAVKGWLTLSPSEVKLTKQGLLFYDSLAALII